MNLVSDYIAEFISDLTWHLTVKPRMNKLKKLLPDARIRPAGSRYVCSPPVFGTDIDFLIYCKDDLNDRLVSLGYKKTEWKDYSGYGDKRPITTWRKGVVNLIVTASLQYAETFDTATHLCRWYNLRRKWYRVLVHEALRGEVKILGDDFMIEEGGYNELEPALKALLISFQGPYGNALIKAYRARHDLEAFNVSLG